MSAGKPAADTYVRARIDGATKQRAQAALQSMGLSLSDAIRLLMFKVAHEQRLPFEIKAPSPETEAALAELDGDKGKAHESVDALMAELNDANKNVNRLQKRLQTHQSQPEAFQNN
ncbi:MAG: type II toxin-antitoxin system RelB/DinJ family antitoxin [Alphaproteobacteria bacterium]|nr:type II toxin-antitoxin system RelB/DinJ family antitoxin [Alphaproteobacteria bacterium]